jgi:hypothetical protein
LWAAPRFREPHEIKNRYRVTFVAVIDGMYRRWRLQQRSRLLDLAGDVRDSCDRPDLFPALSPPWIVPQGLCTKVFEIALAKERFPRKGAKKTVETRQRFAPLRLCVRNLRKAQGLFVQSCSAVPPKKSLLHNSEGVTSDGFYSAVSLFALER